jgi:phosphoglycerate dehydrogenase-like enzyme
LTAGRLAAKDDDMSPAAAETTVLVLGDRHDPPMRLLSRAPSSVRFAFGTKVDDFEPSALSTAEAVLVWWRGHMGLDAVLARASRVRWVHSSAAGLDHMLSPGLVASSAVLSNSRGAYSEALGEYVLAAMLFFVKDIARLRAAQARRVWEQFESERLAGKVLSIVGYGDIGREIARRAHPLGVRVIGFRRRAALSQNDPFVERIATDLRDAVAAADFVVVATPLTPETEHMIGREQLGWMRPESVLINVGRGRLVDEAALVDVLLRGAIRGAALDVFETEPLAEASPLWTMSNVLLSPHCADRVDGWLDRTMEIFLAHLDRFLSGAPLPNVVDKALGY